MPECPLFSIPSLAFIACGLFDDGCSDWCEVIPHYSFDLHFSNSYIEHLFMCSLAICMPFWGKCLVLVFCPLFSWVVCFSGIELNELFVYFGD